MKKTMITVLAMVVLLSTLILSSCNTDTANTETTDTATTAAKETATPVAATEEPATPTPAEPVSLRISWWGSQTRHDKMFAIIDEYMSRNSYVEIQGETTQEQLVAQIAASDAPDIFWTTINDIALFAEKNVYLDLTPYVGNVLDTSTIDESILESGIIDGKLYCIANGVNTTAMVYDPDIFAQAGIAEPPIDWTWDDLISISLELKNKLGVYGLGNSISSYVIFHYFLRQNGYEWYSEDGKSFAFDDVSIIEDFMQLALDLQEQGVYPPPEILSEIKGTEDSLLAKGQAAMMFIDSNQITTLSTVAQKPLKFLINPGPNNDKGMFLKPSCYICGYSETEFPDEVAKYINYFINDTKAGEIFMANVGVPASSVVNEHLIGMLEGDEKIIFQRQVEFIDLVAKHSSPINLLYPAGHNEVKSLLSDIVAEVLHKVTTPEDAAKKFFEEASKILADS